MTNKQPPPESRPIIHLLVKIGSISYILGTLRFNRKELSYFLIDPRQPPSKHLYLENSEMTAPLEHITWHTNRIHIKRQDGIELDPIELSEPLLCEPPILTPLYVESLYFDNTPPLVTADQFCPWKGAATQKILTIDSLDKFSIIFILTPENHPTPWVLSNLALQIPREKEFVPCAVATLCTQRHRPGRIKIWEGWDMIVLTTPYAQCTSSPVNPRLGTKYRIPNYKNVLASLSDLVNQASSRHAPHLQR